MDEEYDDHLAAVEALKRAENIYSSMSYDDLYGPVMECLEMDPDIGRAWELNGLAMFYHGDMDGAMTAFREAVSRKGYYPEAKWALTMMESEKWPHGDDTEAEIKRCYMLGERYLNDRKWKGAALCFSKIANLVETDWRTHSIMGLIHREMGSLEKSLEEYEKAASMDGAPPEIDFDLSTVLIKLGRFEEAEGLLLDLMDRIGPSSPLLNNLGTAIEAQGRDDDAMIMYEDAIEMDPKYYPALYSKGRLLQKKGKMEQAREILESALDREGRVFDIDDMDAQKEREADGDIHIKEVMVKKDFDND